MYTKTIVQITLLVWLASCISVPVYGQAKSSALPPIPAPAINNVPANAKWLVKVTNRGSDEPLEVSSKLYQSSHAFGGGLLKMRNVSGKKIIAFRGEWIVRSTQDKLYKEGWNYGNGTALFLKDALFPSGTERELPVGGPIAEIFPAPDKIRDISVRITGVVFADRTHWGEDGYRKFEKVLNEVNSWTIVTKRVKEACSQRQPEEMVRILTTSSPNIFVHGDYQQFFRRLLLEGDKYLRPDTMQKIDRMLELLNSF